MTLPFAEKPYRPLPDFLTIKKSKIEGLGLFTEKNIKQTEVLGISHLLINYSDMDYNNDSFVARTPLGGFINHSEDPNCEKVFRSDINMWFLVSKRPIKKGEELTLKYTFYNL